MSDTPDMSEDGNKQNLFDFDRSKGNFSFPERHKFNAGYGLTEATCPPTGRPRTLKK